MAREAVLGRVLALLLTASDSDVNGVGLRWIARLRFV